ncbi:MAG: TRAP transporter small permease subunit [Sphingomonadales bacterium]
MDALNRITRVIDGVNEHIGRVVSWAALCLVLTQFVIVIMRYVFGIGSIFLQESLSYFHGALFMAGAGYTLLHEGHVRVDILYRDAAPRTKAISDLIGAVFLLLPVCVLIWWLSWPFVDASWAVLEGSRETSGIQAVFLLKSLILVFAALVGMQGVSMAASAVCRLATGMPAAPDDLTPTI